MKLKGHCLIELTDKKTGEVERYEEHNTVTAFASELFKQMGYLRPNAFASRESLPIDDLFGGIMCFDSAISENADMTGRHATPLYAPASKTMVANGSMVVTSNLAPSECGQYNSASSEATATSRKYVYNWDENEGIGTIGSVCLTSKLGGYKGVGNTRSQTCNTGTAVVEPMEANDQYYGANQTSLSSASRVAYINRSTNVIGVVHAFNPSSGTLTIKDYDISGVAINPFKPLNNIDDTKARVVATHDYTFTAITDTVDCWWLVSRYGHWFIVTASNPNSDANVINVLKFNLDNTQEQYRFPNVNMGYMYAPHTSRFIFAFLGNYFIVGNVNLGTYAYSNYCKSIHTGTKAVTNLGTLDIVSPNNIGGDMVLEDRMYIGGSYIIRLVSGVPTLERVNASGGTGRGYNGWNSYGQFVDDPYTMFITTADGSSMNAFTTQIQGTLNREYLATIFNLDSPVQKSGDKTMKITYTLTLVTS